MNCAHCKTELTPHDAESGAKKDAMHCYGCGCCFLSDGVTPREGVPLCVQAGVSLSSAEPEHPAREGLPPSVPSEPEVNVSPGEMPLSNPRSRARK